MSYEKLEEAIYDMLLDFEDGVGEIGYVTYDAETETFDYGYTRNHEIKDHALYYCEAYDSHTLEELVKHLEEKHNVDITNKAYEDYDSSDYDAIEEVTKELGIDLENEELEYKRMVTKVVAIGIADGIVIDKD